MPLSTLLSPGHSQSQGFLKPELLGGEFTHLEFPAEFSLRSWGRGYCAGPEHDWLVTLPSELGPISMAAQPVHGQQQSGSWRPGLGYRSWGCVPLLKEFV